MKKAWLYIVGLIAALIAALKITNDRKNAAEANVALTDTKIADAEIETKRKANASLYAELEAKKKDLKEKGLDLKGLSPEEIEDYWSKR